jgi:enoyl-CoA hydratase/carnithine racemase
MSDTVGLEIDAAGIARITLDQPNSRANTLHRAVWEQLESVCATLAKQEGLQGLIIQSAKPGIFIAGADLREIADLPIDDPEPTRALVRRGRNVLAALESLPFPTIAVIDGAALGGGFEVALACDSRIAGTNPKIKVGLPETKLGLIPGWGGTQRPARIVGFQAGAELVCGGEPLSADQAHKLGLIDDVVDSERLDDVAVGRLLITKQNQSCRSSRHQKKAAAVRPYGDSGLESLIVTLPTEQRVAASEALRVVTEGAPLPLDTALQIEEEAFVPLVASENARRLIAAFLKR